VSDRKRVVERYFEGFRQGDHEAILGCLTDDVVWDLPGFKHLEGKEAFGGEIVNEAFEGRPTLAVDRLIEEGDTVVAIGDGQARRKDGAHFRFAFADVFTFRAGAVSGVESYLVALGQPAPTGERGDVPRP
jgi:ketosteroid isomerase-like protein